MCISVDYLLVPKEELDNFVTLARQMFGEGKPLAGFADSEDNTSVISDRHVQRILSMIEEAEKAGVKSVVLGGDGNPKKRQLPLTLLINPGNDLKVMQEEIFGPILPVLGYTSLDDTVSPSHTPCA